MKKVITIAALFVATTMSVVAIEQLHNPIDDLRNNPEYVALQHKDKELEMQEDSVLLIISHTREQFRIYADSLTANDMRPTAEEFATISDRILELEQQVFDIRTMRGDVIARINEMDQAWVLQQMNAPVEDEVVADTTVTDVEKPKFRNLVDNHCLRDMLATADYEELLAAQREDAEMDALVVKFRTLFQAMSDTAEGYRVADNEKDAEVLFAKFYELKTKAEELTAEIERRWNHILDTKYYAYGYILESTYNYDLLDSSSAEFTEMRRECSREAGNYASDAIMHYALGRPTLRKFEHDFARTMELEEAADSIATIQREAPEIDYMLMPVGIERRLFIDYQPITIGRTNFYKESNPIPALKVYERGTIYRILLGEFRNKQPMTLFKGVQPLYITRNDDGNYVYYAGGFATRSEADDALLFLKEKDFKAPEICRWQNGVMENITKMESDGDVAIPVMGKRYMIKIVSDALSDDVRQVIDAEAPRKSLSKDADGFVLGMFDNYDEAELLVSLLSDKTTDVVEVIEIELNE